MDAWPEQKCMHAGTVGIAPSFVQRSLLILLERMGPYLAERISSAARTPFEADGATVRAARESPTVDPGPADVPTSAQTATQGGFASGVKPGRAAQTLKSPAVLQQTRYDLCNRFWLQAW